MLDKEKLLELNKKAKKQKFPKCLDAYQLKKLKLSNNCTWDVVKVIPCHFIDKALVPRYFRFLMQSEPSTDNTTLLASAEISAAVALCTFAIDVAEQDYVEMFGEFNEEY